MTANKNLKKRIRARQAETGESYVTARRHVLASASDAELATELATEPAEPASSKPPAIVVDEMLDLTAHGQALGFACRVYASGSLDGLVGATGLVDRMRSILDATTEDPDMELMRAVILRGEHIAFPPREATWWEETRTFIQRALAGVGGISPGRNMLAFMYRERMILANIGFRPRPLPTPLSPRLLFSALVEDGFSMSLLFAR